MAERANAAVLPIAPCDRPPRPDGLSAARLVSGLRSRPSSRLGPTRRLPKPWCGFGGDCRVRHSNTVAGAAPDFTGFPILLPVKW